MTCILRVNTITLIGEYFEKDGCFQAYNMIPYVSKVHPRVTKINKNWIEAVKTAPFTEAYLEVQPTGDPNWCITTMRTELFQPLYSYSAIKNTMYKRELILNDVEWQYYVYKKGVDNLPHYRMDPNALN